ncbi:hypothetical protein HanRHA438_Chr16g0783541 [Helianthus annuus]|nr:hypothetical protein HanRHA438_Chr16g0783541 [Helianthus annuus]
MSIWYQIPILIPSCTDPDPENTVPIFSVPETVSTFWHFRYWYFRDRDGVGTQFWRNTGRDRDLLIPNPCTY